MRGQLERNRRNSSRPAERVEATAVISRCGNYRYELTRAWGPGAMVEFIMLNPSTADATANDPTIRRCMSFARLWGYDGILVRNLYAYRATDPKELTRAKDPFGPDNDRYLGVSDAARTIAAWGANPAAQFWWHSAGNNGRPRVIRRRSGLYCLGLTAAGHPRHPLYVPARATATPWSPPCGISARGETR